MAVLKHAPGNANVTATAVDQLMVKIFSPSRTFFEGRALSLSALNATGPFDILPKHANFICLLLPSDIRVDVGTQVFTFPVTSGLLRVTYNTVTVFLDL